jgi:hypothetical protein
MSSGKIALLALVVLLLGEVASLVIGYWAILIAFPAGFALGMYGMRWLTERTNHG